MVNLGLLVLVEMMMMLCYERLSALSLLQTSHLEVGFEGASHKEVEANDQ